MRSGRAGMLNVALGAQASATTSGGRLTAAGAGPLWAAGAAARAARHTTVSPSRVMDAAPDKLLSLQLFDALLRLVQELAGLEFGQQALEVGQCLGFLIGSDQSFRQIVVNAVPLGEFG